MGVPEVLGTDAHTVHVKGGVLSRELFFVSWCLGGKMLFPELVHTALSDDPGDVNEGACETKYWGLQDANFNLLGIAGTDGSFAERYEYTPYGQRTVFKESHAGDDPLLTAPILNSQPWEVSSVSQPYGICDIGHQGLFFDKEWQWYDVRTRPYGPVMARFPVRDGEYHDGMNLYQYLKNSPLGKKDPLGRESEPTCQYPCVCGPQIDGVLLQYMQELWMRAKSQLRRGDVGVIDGLFFLKNNGGAMDMMVHKISEGETTCPSGTPCQNTATLAGKCIHGSQLNNIIYGFMASMAGVFQSDAEMGADLQNRVAKGVLEGEGRTQRGSYDLGYATAEFMGDPDQPITAEAYSKALGSRAYNDWLSRASSAIEMASGDDKYKQCMLCPLKATKKHISAGFLNAGWNANNGAEYKAPERIKYEWGPSAR